MNFEHPEHRRMLVDSLDRFLAERYAFDPREHMAKASHGFSRETWRQLAGLGVLAALFRESAGGLGGNGFDIAAVFESLGRAVVVEPVLGVLMVGEVLHASGTTDHNALLGRIIDGACVAALTPDEPAAHHELAHVRTTARRGEGGWILEGAKAAIPQGEQADVFLVPARTSGHPGEEAGISLFLVPAHSTGLAVRGCPAIDGGRVAELTFTGLAVPASALVGPADQGFPILERAVGRGLLALCAEALGAMEAAKAATLDFLRTRRQFGAPIGSFQALQHRMADLLLEIEQARSAVINAAAAIDDSDRVVRERALSAAKHSIGRIGTLVAEECIQMHGGMGMTWELPVPHHAKRLVMIDHQLGDEDHHLQRYIALGRVPAVA